MSERKGALSPLRRGIGLLVLISAIVLGGAVGVLLRSDRSVAAAPPPLATAWVVFAALGGVVALIGAAIYGIVLSTCCFTFDFTRPYTPSLGAKLWLANLVVQLLVVTGFTLVIAPPLMDCGLGIDHQRQHYGTGRENVPISLTVSICESGSATQVMNT